MGLVNRVHCCRSDGRLPFCKFHEAIEDSGGDRAESNGCVSALFADVFKLLSLISEDSELQVPSGDQLIFISKKGNSSFATI